MLVIRQEVIRRLSPEAETQIDRVNCFRIYYISRMKQIDENKMFYER